MRRDDGISGIAVKKHRKTSVQLPGSVPRAPQEIEHELRLHRDIDFGAAIRERISQRPSHHVKAGTGYPNERRLDSLRPERGGYGGTRLTRPPTYVDRGLPSMA